MNENRLIIAGITGAVLCAGVAVAMLTSSKLEARDQERIAETLRNPVGEGQAESYRLKVIKEVPDFKFDSTLGREFSRDDLEGRVWVADFIFTSCAGICPKMTEMMQILQNRLVDAPEVRFISFTVDPSATRSSTCANTARNGERTPRSGCFFAATRPRWVTSEARKASCWPPRTSP